GPAVPPRAKSVRRVPIHPHVMGGAVVCDQRGVSEVFEAGMLAGVVGDLAVEDLRALRTGPVQELLDLVAPDVAEDSSVLGLVPEPCGTRRGIEAVGSEPDDLENAADGPFADELPGANRRFDVQPLGVVDRVLPACLGDLPARRVELLEGGE